MTFYVGPLRPNLWSRRLPYALIRFGCSFCVFRAAAATLMVCSLRLPASVRVMGWPHPARLTVPRTSSRIIMAESRCVSREVALSPDSFCSGLRQAQAFGMSQQEAHAGCGEHSRSRVQLIQWQPTGTGTRHGGPAPCVQQIRELPGKNDLICCP